MKELKLTVPRHREQDLISAAASLNRSLCRTRTLDRTLVKGHFNNASAFAMIRRDWELVPTRPGIGVSDETMSLIGVEAMGRW